MQRCAEGFNSGVRELSDAKNMRPFYYDLVLTMT
jgi:hypothetical protein